MPKFVFLDVDGTLVDFTGSMSETTELALKEARNNGHKMILCTGRYYGQIYPWLLKRVNFDGIVSSSGACIRYGGKIIFTKYFTREHLETMQIVFKKAGASDFYHVDGGLIAQDEDVYNRAKQAYRNAGVSDFVIGELLQNLEFRDISSIKCGEKAIYCGSKFKMDEMRAMLGGEFTIDPLCIGGAPGAFGEVNRADVSKGSGIRELIAAVGGDMTDTVAVGDAGNDFSMIKAAHIGVAMGNASDELKAIADMVTDDVDKNGIYVAFRRLGLI